MSRVFISGATGFVGRHLVNALRGREIVAGVRAPADPSVLGRNVAIVPFDLERPAELSPDVLRGTDCVYHLAARVHVMHPRPGDEAEFRRLNACGTETLARKAILAGVRKFVFLSSVKVNGERTFDRPFSPLDHPAPEDAYGRSKLQAEQALLRLAADSRLEVSIVRAPLVYGPGVGANFLRLISLVDKGWPLPFGAVRNRRSLVSVWNLVDLLLRLGDAEANGAGIWFVSDDDDLSTPRLIDLIGKALGRNKASLAPVPIPVLRLLGAMTRRRMEVGRLVDSLQIDVSGTRAALGWHPPMSVGEGVSRTVASVRSAARGTA